MRLKIIFIVVLVIVLKNLKAQIVNIPDVNFKNAVVSNSSINTNMDTEIQVTEAAAYVGFLDLASIGVADFTGIESFTSITILNAPFHSGTTIDLTANTELQVVDLSNGSLSSIILGNNPNLNSLNLNNNDLTSIDLTNCDNINEIALSGNALTNINLSNLTNAQNIALNNNQLTSLDLSGINQLIYFEASNNLLNSIDLSDCSDLVYVGLYSNMLTSLDFSHCSNLSSLNVSNNFLTALNVKNGNNSNFTYFQANSNNPMCIQVDDVTYAITNWTLIDGTSNFNETCPWCIVSIPDVNFKNGLLADPLVNTNSDTEIQCTEAISATTIVLNGAGISDLTGIEWFENLEILWLSSNNISNIDLINNTAITELVLSANNLSSIDLNSLSQLFYLDVSDNNLTTLDLSVNSNLQHLYTQDNALTSISVAGLTQLETFHVEDNQLTAVDLSSCSSIVAVYTYNNSMNSLDLSSNSQLTTLNCSNSGLTELNVKNGNNSNLLQFYSQSNNLECIVVDDADYSTAYWTNIDTGDFFDEYCNTGLVEEIEIIDFYPNPTSSILYFKTNESIHYFIYSLTGELLKEGVDVQVDISSLSSGIYYIKVNISNAEYNHQIIKL